MSKKYSIRIKSYAEKLRPGMIRSGFNLTEAEKAELAEFGITAKTWTKAIINEEHFTDLDVISRFAGFLQVNVNDLIDG